MEFTGTGKAVGMRIDESKHGAVTVLRLCGSICLDDAELLRASLTSTLDRTFGRFVIDLSGATFLDSRALEVLVETNDKLSGRGQSLRVCGVNVTLAEVFDLTGVGQQLDRHDDVVSAVRSFL